MAHFYGSVQGGRGEATRLGHKNSGIRAMAQGWNQGVSINGYYNEEEDRDEFTIYATGGGNGGGSDRIVAATNEFGQIEPVINNEALSIAVQALKDIANDDHGERTDQDRAERALTFIFQMRFTK